MGVGFRRGLSFGLLWALGDAFWHGLQGATAGRIPSAVSLVLSVGACVPWAAALGIAWGLVQLGWRETGAGRWARRALAGLSSGDAPGATRLATLSLTAATLLALWLALGFGGTRFIVPRIRTLEWLAALLTLASTGLALVLAAGAPIVWLGWSRAVRRAGRYVGPARLLVALALPLGLALCAALYAARAVVSGLPWRWVTVPTLVALWLVALRVLSSPRPALGRALERTRQLGLALALGGALYAAGVPASQRAEVAAVLESASLGGLALKMNQRLTDFDGDGAAAAFGGGDCAPFDRKRGPSSLEIPSNGIDEDCSGRDLKLAATQLVLTARHPLPEPKRPHVFLITTDALTFEHTGLGGYRRPVTPELDAWAQRATLFETAFSHGPETLVALPALLSGSFSTLWPGLLLGPAPAADTKPLLLQEALRGVGYRTHAILGDAFFSQERWPALTLGFDTADILVAGKGEHTARRATEAALRVVERITDTPTFLWVHYYDHHAPYDPLGDAAASVPEALTSGDDPIAQYDRELWYADHHWGSLLRAIETRFEPGEYLTVFTADHGEAFDANHLEGRHATSLRTPELHVPLVVQSSARRGVRIDGLVSHLDLVPTILDITGATGADGLHGESLTPVLFRAAAPEKTAVFAAFHDRNLQHYQTFKARQLAARTASFNFITDLESGVRWTYRWREDQLEHNNLAGNSQDVDDLGTVLLNYFRREIGQ